MAVTKIDKHQVNQTKSNLDETFGDTRLRWYIVQTYVGFEDAVKKSLDLKIQNLNLQDRITEIFIPTKTVMKLNRKGEREEKAERIYPGYIYIKLILDREVAYVMQNTNYISRIAGTGDYAVALEDGYVEKLKEELLKDKENTKVSTKTSFKIGDLIVVIDGPFKDMQGKISGIDPQSSRISVLLTIFDRETNVELDVLEVKKLLG